VSSIPVGIKSLYSISFDHGDSLRHNPVVQVEDESRMRGKE